MMSSWLTALQLLPAAPLLCSRLSHLFRKEIWHSTPPQIFKWLSDFFRIKSKINSLASKALTYSFPMLQLLSCRHFIPDPLAIWGSLSDEFFLDLGPLIILPLCLKTLFSSQVNSHSLTVFSLKLSSLTSFPSLKIVQTSHYMLL